MHAYVIVMRACREMPAVPPALVPSAIATFVPLPAPKRRSLVEASPRVARTRHPVRQMRAFEPVGPTKQDAVRREPLHEHPLVVGALIVVLPPMGIAAVWASKRYSFAGKLAVTLFTAFAMLVAAATAVLLVALELAA
jgi:hypothetical protein